MIQGPSLKRNAKRNKRPTRNTEKKYLIESPDIFIAEKQLGMRNNTESVRLQIDVRTPSHTEVQRFDRNPQIVIKINQLSIAGGSATTAVEHGGSVIKKKISGNYALG